MQTFVSVGIQIGDEAQPCSGGFSFENETRLPETGRATSSVWFTSDLHEREDGRELRLEAPRHLPPHPVPVEEISAFENENYNT